MKLFFKVLLFTFTMMTTVGAVKSSTVAGTLQEETSYSFFQKSQFATIVSENHFENSCFNGEKVVDYGERVKGVEGNLTKGGTNVGKNVFTVTKEGVALPKGAKIPRNYVQNPYRSSNYGVFENGKFVEKLRIDQATSGI